MPQQPPDNPRDWNELGYISWKSFRQMAPPIIQLEITRISRLLDKQQLDAERHNLLVQVRFELEQFNEKLASAGKEQVAETCAPHLQKALASLSLFQPDADGEWQKTVDYIRDRINYINERIPLIY